MRIKILFRLLLLAYAISVVCELLNGANSTSTFALADEVHLLSMAAFNELTVYLTITIWFLGTIVVFFLVSWIGLFFFLKWARQLYVFSMIGIVILIPAFLKDPAYESIELLDLAPLFFVLVLIYIRPIKLFFDKKVEANQQIQDEPSLSDSSSNANR